MRAVPPIHLRPTGQTALLDAIGDTIVRTRRFVRGRPKTDQPDEILILILTDGRENASRAFDRPTARDMIDAQRSKKRRWQFALLGADAAVYEFARSLGIAPETTLRYDHDLSETALTVAGRMASRASRASQTGQYGFTDEERTSTRH